MGEDGEEDNEDKDEEEAAAGAVRVLLESLDVATILANGCKNGKM